MKKSTQQSSKRDSQPDDILATIIETTRADLALWTPAPLVSGRTQISGRFRRALKEPNTVSIIAEFKKRSPSAGDIRPGACPDEIARLYEQNGAGAMSVLTDRRFFGGSLDDLAAVRRTTNLPLIRKDFMIDERQIDDAAAVGADAILLIVAALSDSDLRRLLAHSEKCRLDVLVEAHDGAELTRALRLDATVIGINNRNLKTMKTDIETGIRLAETIPASRRDSIALVAESGLKTHSDIQKIADAGFDAALIGETLMASPDVGAALASFTGGKKRASPRATTSF